ncbi:acyl-CoA reductase [Tellurirhabdus bombi]|uniref:acyl-CoA reductase n=1 Tax=Tellurirhabdus bombi TaxID=2907205 RepID=UPI001F333A23|nr:acyl-CoA reductase [Tellurirhabdus bombi]
MRLPERIKAFVDLGNFLREPASQPELQEVAQRAYSKNHWFTPENTLQALAAIADEFLTPQKLEAWALKYNSEPKEAKKVGVVMAGNIPAVGFHDLLSVLISGHTLMAKLSSQDFVLIQFFIQKITEIEPRFADYIQVAERLNQADAFIATGSDNTARYFEYYFSKKPNIIRKNRTSVGILNGAETDEELVALGNDLLDYFGLGCRNASTLFVPEYYNFTHLLDLLAPMGTTFANHHKYVNNYDYNKSIYLVNGVPHLDSGFLLLTENESLVSPISVVYFQTYQTEADLTEKLSLYASKIQAIAASKGWYPGSVPFGQTQRPTLTDYADGIDTMAFLKELGA